MSTYSKRIIMVRRRYDWLPKFGYDWLQKFRLFSHKIGKKTFCIFPMAKLERLDWRAKQYETNCKKTYDIFTRYLFCKM